MRPPGVTLRELTAPAAGGVSVLELRGPGALAAVEPLMHGGGGRRLTPGAPRLVRLGEASGELLDEALLWIPSAGLVELHVHGSRPLVRRLVRELGFGADGSPWDGEGASGAPGSPSLEERAEVALSRAPTEVAARVLLDQSQGALRSALEGLRGCRPVQARERLAGLARRGRALEHLFEPARVVLAGPANAGKSTLFNHLLGRERAVVDGRSGTTRDALQDRIEWSGWAIDLVDTAGLRVLAPGDDDDVGAIEVELIGQRLTRMLLGEADLVLWLDPDPGRPLPAGLETRRARRWTPRADLLSAEERASATGAISVQREPEQARASVIEGIRTALELRPDVWSPGEAVPFDERTRVAVAALVDATSTDELAAGLDSILGG